MSSQAFLCTVKSGCDQVVPYFHSVKQLLTGSANLGSENAHFSKAVMSSIKEGLDVSIRDEDGSVSIEVDAPNSVNLGFFEELVAPLYKMDDIQFKARLFLSSSGGVQTWEYPEGEALALDGKLICLVGEMSSDFDEFEDAGEDCFTLTEDLTDNVDVIVLGEDLEEDQLEAVQAHKAIKLTEDDFWDLVLSFPG